MPPAREKGSPHNTPPGTSSSRKNSTHSLKSISSLDSNNNNGLKGKGNPGIAVDTHSDPRPRIPQKAFGTPDSSLGVGVPSLTLRSRNMMTSSMSLTSVSTIRTGRGTSQSSRGSPGQFWARLKPDIELNFVKPLEDQYECALCQQVLRYPVLMACGHHCCNSCMADILRLEPRCPIDQTKVDKSQLTNDRALQKEIELLFVRCANMSMGCVWTGYLKELLSHLDRCDYTLISCPSDCSADFERRFLSQHLEDDCPRRTVPCEFCTRGIPLDDMNQHFGTCKKFLVDCPNKCGQDNIVRESLPVHLENQCPEQVSYCPFYESGCTFKAKRKELKSHICRSPDTHLEMMAKSLHTCTDALEIHDAILERQADRLNDVENQVAVMDKLNGYQLIWKIDNYKRKYEEAMENESLIVESPVFSAFRHGYRMVVSICPNGDGKAQGKYVSLYVSLVKGEYDAILPWPFSLDLTISLLDQCKDPSARRDHVQELRPNAVKENLVFLKRPLADRNPSFGLTRFIEIEKLKTMDYIKNNVMFVKIQVNQNQVKQL